MSKKRVLIEIALVLIVLMLSTAVSAGLWDNLKRGAGKTKDVGGDIAIGSRQWGIIEKR